jgi:two-component system, chemotaxis family, chemotaxis protein CheY
MVAMPKCILIVDDNLAIRTSIRHFLEAETDFEVCGEAVDGLDAIEKARELNPDLIILDLSMPRMDGLQAARVLRRMLPHVPIVLFTLHRDAIGETEASDAGVSAVVSKTGDLVALADEIARLLEPV